jgi:HK97 family phage portal protein
MSLIRNAFSNKTPIPFVADRSVSRYVGLLSSGGNRSAELATMGRVGIINAIVGMTAQSVGSVDWKLYQSSITGKEEDRIEVTRHPALILLNKPNQFFTRQQTFEAVQQHISLTGEGYWIIEYGDFLHMPIRIWYARPDKMEPVKSSTEFLVGWIYKGPDGEDVPLNVDEVIQFVMPDPEDPYRGMSPIRSVITDIASSTAMSAWVSSYFYNNAEPGGIIEIPGSPTDTEFKRLQQQWGEHHRGISRAHRVGLLENGMKWISNVSTLKDMTFVPLDERLDEKIRQAYHFPKPMLGAVDDVNRANADAAEVVYGRQIIKPNLDRFKGELNNIYLPMFGPSSAGLEFDYSNPVPDDQQVENDTLTAKAKAASLLVAAGYDPAEVCYTVGLPLMEWYPPTYIDPNSTNTDTNANTDTTYIDPNSTQEVKQDA